MILLLISLFAIPIIINNIILTAFANQLYNLPLPVNTKIVSKTQAAGNFAPTGNHLDFLAIIEVESSLTEEELIKYYSDKTLKPANDVSFLKPKRGFYDDVSFVRAPIKISIIPKNQAYQKYPSSKSYIKGNTIDKGIDNKLFIIQILDGQYDPGWDLRAN